jgi:hypothetical protein
LWGEICSGHWEEEGGNGDAGREGIADCSGASAREVVSATFEGAELEKMKEGGHTATRLLRQERERLMVDLRDMSPCVPELPLLTLQQRQALRSR